jgi:hypothetical protein
LVKYLHRILRSADGDAEIRVFRRFVHEHHGAKAVSCHHEEKANNPAHDLCARSETASARALPAKLPRQAPQGRLSCNRPCVPCRRL